MIGENFKYSSAHNRQIKYMLKAVQHAVLRAFL